MGDVVDLTRDGGVVKQIIRKAKAGALHPSENLPNVDVHYEGKFADIGEIFDSTEDNTVFTFEIGQASVIRAWEIAVKTMQVGEIALITCKPDYAYGQAGAPPEIPPGATLVFEIELLGARPPKGSILDSVAAEKAKLEEVRKERDLTAAKKEEDKKKREEAKAAAAARMQAKMESRKGGGQGNKGKKVSIVLSSYICTP
ncbi:peptidyl-prolyl cis-trans isomerase FKBP20-1 [Physcomitrium patens]|uniref:peptidyl-prolyl cis-trans isomerase FKBP20-1 n=1 Tax=Physcomitrium patens TaxID=3218 RepID=UPI003CCD453A